jgi:hypothetical protein
VLLTFDFNSQDRQWTEVQAAHKAEVVEPLQKEPNPQEGNAPSHNAIEMMRAKYARHRNGWLKALMKELKNIIDNSTLGNTAKLEANEPVMRTVKPNNIKMDSHGPLGKLKCRMVVRGDMEKKKHHIQRRHVPPISSIESTYFAARHKCIIYQFDVIGSTL